MKVIAKCPYLFTNFVAVYAHVCEGIDVYRCASVSLVRCAEVGVFFAEWYRCSVLKVAKIGTVGEELALSWRLCLVKKNKTKRRYGII